MTSHTADRQAARRQVAAQALYDWHTHHRLDPACFIGYGAAAEAMLTALARHDADEVAWLRQDVTG